MIAVELAVTVATAGSLTATSEFAPRPSA